MAWWHCAEGKECLQGAKEAQMASALAENKAASRTIEVRTGTSLSMLQVSFRPEK